MLSASAAFAWLTSNDGSQVVTQFVGMAFTLASLNGREDIRKMAGTYWDANPHLIHELVKQRYDQAVGILCFILPTMAQPAGLPAWACYIILAAALVLRFSPARGWYTSRTGRGILADIERGSQP